MKKYFSILVLVLVVTLITGCSNKNIVYKFTYSPSAAESTKVVEEPEGIVSVEYSDDSKKCGDNNGCSLNAKYKIVGKKEGKTKVTITKYNDAHNEIINRITYDIQVDKNLNITETHVER